MPGDILIVDLQRHDQMKNCDILFSVGSWSEIFKTPVKGPLEVLACVYTVKKKRRSTKENLVSLIDPYNCSEKYFTKYA